MLKEVLRAGLGVMNKASVVTSVLIALFNVAGGPGPVSAQAAEIAFVATKGNEEVSITVPELEALGLHRVKTKTPWEAGELNFEGVLFGDVVEYLGFTDASAVRVRALDDYVQDIPRDDWLGKPLILATRQDGEPLTRRTQGPTRLVYPLSEYPGYVPLTHDPRWIWLIKHIERVK